MIQAAFLGAANMVIEILIQMSQWPRGCRENHSCFALGPAESGSKLVCGSTISQANNRVVVQSGHSLL